MKLIAKSIALAVGLAGASLVCADTSIHFADGQGAMLISQGKLAMRNGQGQIEMIFDAGSGEMTSLHHQQQQYMVLNRQQQQEMLTRMEQAMAQMRKQMEQQLAQMPAEQRQQMQQRMQSMPGMSGKPEPKTSVSDTGESKTVGAYSCRIKSVALDGEPVAEACVASAESLGIGKADADALRAFSDFGAAMSAGSPHPLSSELEGLPIEYRSLADDQVTRIETVDDKAIDATSFQVPAGFQKVDPLASMPR